MKFTTSWDDGYALDLKVANILDTYGCKGTFYACPNKQHEKDMLNESDIALLQERHEIGAHTLRHVKLTEVTALEAKTEIEMSKDWVEQITGTKCDMFCYPYGFNNPQVQTLVKNAGYKGARTTEQLMFVTEDPFHMTTTLQITPFPNRKTWSRWWHPLDPLGPLRVRRKGLKKLGIKSRNLKTWLDLAINLFDYGLENNLPVFHLWGHSHEIEKYNMWHELELFLKHVKDSNIECVTNVAVIPSKYE